MRIAPQSALRRPRFLLQIAENQFATRVVLIPPRQPGPHEFLVQIPAIRQDDFGDGALVAYGVEACKRLLKANTCSIDAIENRGTAIKRADLIRPSATFS